MSEIKLKRNALTVKEKLDAIQRIDKGESVKKIRDEFNVGKALSMIGGVIANPYRIFALVLFKNANVSSLPVFYRAQKVSWMDDIFKDWFVNERSRRFRPSTTNTTSGAHGGIVQSRTEVDLILTDFDKDKREAIVSLPRKMLVKYTAGNDCQHQKTPDVGLIIEEDNNSALPNDLKKIENVNEWVTGDDDLEKDFFSADQIVEKVFEEASEQGIPEDSDEDNRA
ncbi:hypothetical protein J6590_061758 [Homalodisca vitripennis]|nr:hypothetical protein J6590_061758 [Homalodisca vitripennis]